MEINTRVSLTQAKSLTYVFFSSTKVAPMLLSERRTIASAVLSSIGTVAAKNAPLGDSLISANLSFLI
ncbi:MULTISPECIES: hypothetical protein [Xanthomonas]|uniref:Uncharacterized protein n=1 Tax=Xanthomonas arboricola pv. guizotiae TaxID=487867 RepID=A0A2S6ZX06_9XANT|nr:MULTISPECIES: hypothetical protein [Xanthomonas]MXV48571.1 hypothetical protein [Xanthomonas sp. LMG 8993]PPT97287.1 hypothetical protein XarbCFBP7409_14500 [Xanthomonas arboricola pv. guizotiae]PPU19052.1 hypothetical protein XarbCFBP7610_14480 [Xanthomonas arboricola]PPU24538.1 hypothetical protein XarbCFBP7408_07925 [Xanthomonas arboricola pv. guizotiae]QWM98914.1 hypothetical protein DGN21_05890 [Xanthomonas sp. MLO165]